MKKVIAGIDLHSNNLVVGIMDQDGKRVGQQKLPCELQAVAKFLAPFKKRLEQVAVGATFYWGWFGDGRQAMGYPGGVGETGGVVRYRGGQQGGGPNSRGFRGE